MTDDRLPIPEGATRLQLLALADEARSRAEEMWCYSSLSSANHAKPVWVGRCTLTTGHDGPHVTRAAANHSDTSQLQAVEVRWETGGAL